MHFISIVPFLFFAKTRLNSTFQKVSWIFVYFLPVFYIFLHFSAFDFLVSNLMLMVISITLINYIYENGYIVNDVILTKSEANPTLRLSNDELVFMRNNIRLIFLARYFVIALMFVGVCLLSKDAWYVIVVGLVCILLSFLYRIYNSHRSILNFYLIFPLSYLRFYGAVLPLVAINDLAIFVVMTAFLYPFIKMLEFGKQSRYNLLRLSHFVGDIDYFRVCYYFVLSVVICIITFGFELDFVYMIVSLYYFSYRLMSFVMMKFNGKFRRKIYMNSKKDFRS